jgi:hypothetical protein
VKIVVLGCGPAGLAAAHAAALSDKNGDIRILSKPRKSFMKGAQYLHQPLPLVGSQIPFDIDYRLVGGTTEDYAKKVYGAARVRAEETSVAVLQGVHPAWDIRSAYDDLWALYGPYVAPWEASHQALAQIKADWKPDVVISSVPAPLLCAVPDEHAFTAEQIWSTDAAMHTGFWDERADEDAVVCNAGPSPAWYRSAIIHGWGTTEWPARVRPPLSGDHLWNVTKPIDNTCTCWPQILRVGRYGCWKKGVLVHDAFFSAYKTTQNYQMQLF